MRSKITIFFTIICLCLLLLPVAVFAAGDATLSYEDGSGHTAVVQDDAQLYSAENREALLSQIRELLTYGNIGIETSEAYNDDAAAYAREEYIRMFGTTDGMLFLIDMHNRRIQIFSGGSVYRTISTSKANEITDNIYTYATEGDYYTATRKAFEQIKIVFEGGHIVTPMRYATNIAFAVGIALLINFIIITVQRKKDKNTNKLTNALVYTGIRGKVSAVKNVQSVMTKQTKTRRSSSSGGGFVGGGGGGGFSGGGGGGGFSGGGGGHSF